MFAVFQKTCPRTPAERKSSRRYVVELLGASVTYVALVFVSESLVSGLGGPAKFFVALLPCVGVVAMATAIVRYISRMDELQRRTFVDAAAIAAVVTATVAMALGFVENAGVPRISMTWVWVIAILSWTIALPFVRRRYN